MTNALSRNVATLKNRVASDNQIGAVGSVTSGQAVPTSTPFVDFFSVTLNNAAGTAAKNYVIFDAHSAARTAKGGSWNVPDSTTALSVTILNESTKNSPLVISGIGYRITTGTTAQYAQSLFFVKTAFDGSLAQKPLNVSKSIRNNQYQDNILHIQQVLPVDSMSGLFLTVMAGTTVVLDFWVGEQLNVM